MAKLETQMAGPKRPLVLNVDDNEIGRYALTRTLERSNFVVIEACNGEEGLRLALSERPDVIVLDVNLPDIHGYEVARRLKADQATASIPILQVTAASVRGPEKARGLESGADSYLTEPIEPEVLVATINSLLRARRAEQAAAEMAREWQGTFNAINDGVAVLDSNGRVLRFNESLTRLLGRAPEQIEGITLSRLWSGPPEDRLPFRSMLASRSRQHEDVLYMGRLFAVTADPMFDESGELAGGVLTVKDITETRRLEEQFQESQKFETIGTLAAGVAHDYNNLLTSIMGNASLALGDETISQSIRERLEEVVGASQRAADLTKQLLAYAGKARHYMQKLELSALVRDVAKLIQAALPKKVKLEFRLAAGLPPVQADPSQVQQMILNLVSNAAEAIGEDSGSITVTTDSDGASVFLEVRDTGCGIDAEHKARIFDPFFTTKFTGRGLGLAAVAGIVRGHKGTIDVSSEPGRGSTFRIAFPAAEPARHAVPEQTAAPQGRTVLVVDDEEMVRRLAKAALEMRGFKVVLAENGQEGIEQARANADIGLVLLDVTMPVLSGDEAISEILAARPNAKVVVSTGYDSGLTSARFDRRLVAAMLQKPYTSRQLLEKVTAVLGANTDR